MIFQNLVFSRAWNLSFHRKFHRVALGALVSFSIGLSATQWSGRDLKAAQFEFSNKTTASGLGASPIVGVFVSGSNVYAATLGGLSVSFDGGYSFKNNTSSKGPGSLATAVYVSGSNVYVATYGGLSISRDGGSIFAKRSTRDGLGSNDVLGVFVSGSIVYAATLGG